jgi:hypothetical protein
MQNETIEPKPVVVMEPVLFTKYNEKVIGKAKPSQIIPILDLLGSEYSLNIKKVKHFRATKRMLINAVKNN